jgi:glucose/arabinose dehydrogenase
MRRTNASLGLAFIFINVLLPLRLMAAVPQLEFTQVSTRTNIVDIANAGDDSHRLFLVEKAGRIFIIKNGLTLNTPFLDIRSVVMSGGERGLLSLEFSPDYDSSGLFYVWYTQDGGDTVLSRFTVSSDADIADASSEEQLLTVAQPDSNHNGGRLRFGPDGMLYLGIGDGGGSNDPDELAQDGSTLLGKLIRIDVDPVHVTYAIPADNPFLSNAGFLNEIWALGLRNPWRISFDTLTGDLFIADVGQSSLEEVNFQLSDSPGGENYGWDIMEGTECASGGCDQTGLTLPVSEYSHADGCSITGGEVYRGFAYPNLYGTYLYADYCSGKIWSLQKSGNDWITTRLEDTGFSITTFGMSEDGNVYLSDESGGVYLISDADSCNVNAVSNITESSDASYEACEILVVGPAFVAEEGASISLSSGWEIMLMPGFTIEPGATLNANVCGQSLCMTSGSPMPDGCHSCVTQICDIDSTCCALDFDQACLNMVDTVCGLVCE